MRNGTYSWGESSSSTSLSSQNDTEDDRMIAIVLSEEYAQLDGAVGTRLSNLAPVPHVPRINSFIPDISDARMDHQRLLDRLRIYGLCEVKVAGDGNCQFRAISDQMYKSPEHHKYVRKEIVKQVTCVGACQYFKLWGHAVLSGYNLLNWVDKVDFPDVSLCQLEDHRSLYECYVPMKYKQYCKKMAKSGEWGDHVTLQAAADKFTAKICLLTSFRDTCFIEIMPQNTAPKCQLWLSFWSEVHYNSLYAFQDTPLRHKPKKKHWFF